MNSDEIEATRRLIDGITEALGAEGVRETITEPIDRALQEFHFDESAPVTASRFNAIIARFHEQLEAGKTVLTRDAGALGAAIAILESGYDNGLASGYEGALAAVQTEGSTGVWRVLEQMAEQVKAERLQTHEQRAIRSLVSPSDWRTKRRIVLCLMSEGWFSRIHGASSATPAQLAPHWYDLILTRLACADPVRSCEAFVAASLSETSR